MGNHSCFIKIIANLEGMQTYLSFFSQEFKAESKGSLADMLPCQRLLISSKSGILWMTV